MSDNTYPQTTIIHDIHDYNTAKPQDSYSVIPKGTIAKVILLIRKGGFDDSSLGATDGWATISKSSNAVYLNCECRVLEGPYYGKTMWTKIGLQGSKADSQWGSMGRSFIRAILNSARGFSEKDDSPEAAAARKIKGYGELNQLEFIACIDIEEDIKGQDRNTISLAIPKGNRLHPDTVSAPKTNPSATTPSWAR